MAQPIDIPAKKSRRKSPLLDQYLFPRNEGPYFGYIELFESGHIYRAISSGSGKFVEVSSRCPLPSLSFVAEKDRLTKRITLEIASSSLKQTVSRAIFNHAPSSAPSEVDFDTTLKYYDVLKVSLGNLRARCPNDDVTLEMRLLVEDLLSERALYSGMSMGVLRPRYELCSTHLQDIHARHINSGLGEIETCFSLGLVPDEMDRVKLRDLNDRYAKLARLGDYAELRNLCEPIVRSGQTKISYSPSLLQDVLDNGHLDVFQYMLDLVDRTRQSSAEMVGSQYTDVTFDPLHIAIRLGSVDAVRFFIQEHATFEGYVVDEASPNPHRIFTPVVAAVYWQQADILRLLLATKKNSIYQVGLLEAMAMAFDQGSPEIQQVLIENQLQPLASITKNGSRLFRENSGSESSMGFQSFQHFDATLNQPSTGMSKSISGIANALNSSASTPSTSFLSSSTTNPLSDVNVYPNYWSAPAPASSFKSRPLDNPLGTAAPKAVRDEIEAATLPFIQRTINHKNRRKLGRGFKQRLEGRCEDVSRVCKMYPTSQVFSDLERDFASLEGVWKTGIKCFRRIIRNRPPSGLSEILRGLVVADALIHQVPGSQNSLQQQFIDDLGRWGTLLDFSEQPTYVHVVCEVWGIATLPRLVTPESGTKEIYRFQELIQNVVSLDDPTDEALDDPGDEVVPKSTSSGAPLLAIQRRVKAQKPQMDKLEYFSEKFQPSGGSCANIGTVFGRLTRATDSSYDEDREFSEFIDFDAFEVAPEDSKVPGLAGLAAPRSQWKDIDPMVVLLLASVAFSVVLTVVSAIQDGSEDLHEQAPWTRSPGYTRSWVVVKKLLSFDEDNADDTSFYDSGVDVETPCEARRSRWISEMREASKTETRMRLPNVMGESTASSLKMAMPGSISSPSGSSYILTDASSPDVDRIMEKRVKCHSCLKTFSTISNHNKHKREGCAMRDRRGGYQCRHGGCTKTLSTKWYRNTHEQTRCRFNESRTRN